MPGPRPTPSQAAPAHPQGLQVGDHLDATKNAFLHGRWTVGIPLRLYGAADWGKGYFDVNQDVSVMPGKSPAEQIDLLDLVNGLADRGVHSPVLIRFSGILEHRLREIRVAFDKAATPSTPAPAATTASIDQSQPAAARVRRSAKIDAGSSSASKRAASP